MFQKTMEKKMKNVWLQSCFINISGWPNKFISDNQFGKTIIILNKQYKSFCKCKVRWVSLKNNIVKCFIIIK